MKVSIGIYLWVLVFFPCAINAQVGSLRVISSSVCSGVVETPILASQINGMAAMSIRLLFDSSAISYQGVRNVHPAIANAVISGANSRFVIAWFSLQPVNLTNDTLVVIRWVNNGGRSSPLQFDTLSAGGCEIANVQAQVMPVQYISGQASITGAQAPVPLNPLRLWSLHQNTYLFVFSRPACMQSGAFQVAKDSLFEQLTYNTALVDTFYNYLFAGIQPSQGDSIRWWRLGGTWNGDTTWSATGRVSFAVSLSSKESSITETKAFPNPFRESVYLTQSAWQDGEEIAIKCFGWDGRLLESKILMVEGGKVKLDINHPWYQGQMLIYWQDSHKNGVLVTNKIGY